MDPDACLQRYRDAMSEHDRDEATAAAIDLAEWLDAGGFEPRWATAAERAAVLAYRKPRP